VRSISCTDLGGTFVELISYEGVPVDPAPRLEHLDYRMMALEVEHMQRAIEYLKGGQGHRACLGPMTRENYYARAEICDPNGFRIELRIGFERTDVRNLKRVAINGFLRKPLRGRHSRNL
jgi:hypothetical protein